MREYAAAFGFDDDEETRGDFVFYIMRMDRVFVKARREKEKAEAEARKK